MKYLRLFEQANVNPNDPFNEEKWGSDDLTMKLKKSLIELLRAKNIREQKINNLIERLDDVGDEVKLYEIRVYGDGGPGDIGYTYCYVKARSSLEAKAIAFVKVKHNIDILFTGFFEARVISQQRIDKEIVSLRRLLNVLENIPSIEDSI